MLLIPEPFSVASQRDLHLKLIFSSITEHLGSKKEELVMELGLDLQDAAIKLTVLFILYLSVQEVHATRVNLKSSL